MTAVGHDCGYPHCAPMRITGRELSWITVGTLLAVLKGNHHYSGTAVEQLAPDRWRVELHGWEGAAGGHKYSPGGVYEFGRDGPDRITSLLGPPFARPDEEGHADA